MMPPCAMFALRTVLRIETRSSACSPVSAHGPRTPSQLKRSPLNSLTARPSEHQRMKETLGRYGEMWGDMGRYGEMWGDMGRGGRPWG